MGIVADLSMNLRLIGEILKEIFSLSLSEGTVRNILTKIGNKPKAICDEIRKRISVSDIVGTNETGQYVDEIFL